MTKLILIHGLKGHGKSTAARMILKAHQGAETFKMARPIKSMLAGCLRHHFNQHPLPAASCYDTETFIDACLEGELKEAHLSILGELSPRTFFQMMDSLGRRIFDELFWMKAYGVWPLSHIRRTGHMAIIDDIRRPLDMECLAEEAKALNIPVTTIKIIRREAPGDQSVLSDRKAVEAVIEAEKATRDIPPMFIPVDIIGRLCLSDESLKIMWDVFCEGIAARTAFMQSLNEDHDPAATHDALSFCPERSRDRFIATVKSGFEEALTNQLQWEQSASRHVSEKGIDDRLFDQVISNDGISLADLERKMMELSL